MLFRFCVGKIHRATVTQADLNYVGSITIDEVLLEKSGIKPFQMVNVHNVSNAAAWQTYVIAGERGSGIICLNGPPARLFQPGDKVIIMAEAYLEASEADGLVPVVVFVDEQNRVTKVERHPLSATNPA
ncbi:MAG TPA: aspartate 1-decarboxylase [Candidatus Acidoferrales bacterium]